jgi:hypothetical protein
LSAEDRAGRDGEFATILQRGLVAREDTLTGIRLRFRRSSGLEEDLADLTRKEKACCPFFDFRIEATGDEVLLEVDAPPDARPIVEQLFALERR